MAIDLSSDPLFDTLQKAGEQSVYTQYGQKQTAMQTALTGKGLARSGFSMQAEGQLNAQKNSDLASMTAQNTEKVMNYRQQEETIRLEQEQLRKMKKKKKHAWLGTALAVVGAVVGTFICPGLGTMAGAMLGNMAGNAATGQPATGGFGF